MLPFGRKKKAIWQRKNEEKAKTILKAQEKLLPINKDPENAKKDQEELEEGEKAHLQAEARANEVARKKAKQRSNVSFCEETRDNLLQSRLEPLTCEGTQHGVMLDKLHGYTRVIYDFV